MNSKMLGNIVISIGEMKTLSKEEIVSDLPTFQLKVKQPIISNLNNKIAKFKAFDSLEFQSKPKLHFDIFLKSLFF